MFPLSVRVPAPILLTALVPLMTDWMVRFTPESTEMFLPEARMRFGELVPGRMLAVWPEVPVALMALLLASPLRVSVVPLESVRAVVEPPAARLRPPIVWLPAA